MYKIRLKVFLFLVTVFTLFSCEITPDKPITLAEDTKPPVITLHNPTPMEIGPYMDYPEFCNLDSLNIAVTFTDNRGLSQYQISIREKNELYYYKTMSDPWEKVIFGFLGGKTEHTYYTKLFIPWDPSAGPYEIEFILEDEAGLIDTLYTYIRLCNKNDSIAPFVNLLAPSYPPTPVFKIGETIPIRAQISDNLAVIDAYVRIRNTFTNVVFPGSEMFFEINPPGFLEIDTSVYVPPIIPGNYSLEIMARDTTHNLGRVLIPIEIETN